MSEQLTLNLSVEIRQTFSRAHSLAVDARLRGADAVAKALECGRLLHQQKSALGKGSWVAWVAENLPDIPYETIARYMRLSKGLEASQLAEGAKDATVESGSEGSSQEGSEQTGETQSPQVLKQAYIALGILPEPASRAGQGAEASKPWVKYTKHLDGFRLWFNRRIEEEPMEKWQENSRRILKNELRWFVELYERL